MKKSILISLLALLMMGCQVSGGSSLKVEETTVEMRKNPEGVAVSAPRFSWQLVTDKQDVMQTAYQIEVADSEKSGGLGQGLAGRLRAGMEQWSCGVWPIGASEVRRGVFGVGTEILVACHCMDKYR